MRRQTARREKAAHHEKNLNGHAGVFEQPVDEPGRRLLHGLRERTIRREMVQDDELRGNRLQGIDQRQALGSRIHAVSLLRICALHKLHHLVFVPIITKQIGQ